MKLHSRYNLSNQFPVFLAVALLISFSIGNAQITIREKVTIVPILTGGKKIGGMHAINSVASGFVMPKKGVVQVYYNSAERLFSSIPSTAKLMVHRRRADSVMADPVLQRFQNQTPVSNSNGSCSPSFWTEYDYSISPQPFSALPVQKGDTVQFFYVTDLDPVNGVLDTLSVASADTTAFGWDNVIFGIYDNCRTTWKDMLNVFVGIADTTIQFSTATSNTVYPTYKNHNRTLVTKDTLTLQLNVQFNGTPVNKYWIKVDSTALVDSGGHSHTGNRPPARFILPKLSDPTKFDTMATFTRQTDTNGVLKFTFIASEFGGLEKINAKLVSDTTDFDTLRISTRVDSLIDFSTISSNFWVLTGNSGLTNLAACHVPIKHYSNHWFYSAKIDSVQKGILFFFKWSGTTDGGGNNLKLGINDMSLKYGGLFDVCSNWQSAHISHRLGLGVDIDSTSAYPFGGGAAVPLIQDQVDQLTRIMRSFGGTRANEKVIHYEFGRR